MLAGNISLKIRVGASSQISMTSVVETAKDIPMFLYKCRKTSDKALFDFVEKTL